MATGMPASTSCGACSMCSSTNALIDLASRLALAHGVEVGAAFGHVLAKGATRVHAPGFEGPCRQHAEGRAAADVGDLEPDAFFGADRRGRDVAVRLQAEALQALDGDEAGDDAGGSV